MGNILISTRIPPIFHLVDWTYLSSDIVIVGHLVKISMVFIDQMTDTTLNIMYDLHNVINLSVDVSHVFVLSYYLVNNQICLKQMTDTC